jgi:hypothetical protein
MYGMNDVLHIPARPGARIACDMSTAVDTPAQRLAAYAQLFADALVRRERGEHSVVFAFRANAQTRVTVEDLVRREAACCPFVDYRVETLGEELVWTTTNPIAGEEGAGAEAMLDAFHELPTSTDALLWN